MNTRELIDCLDLDEKLQYRFESFKNDVADNLELVKQAVKAGWEMSSDGYNSEWCSSTPECLDELFETTAKAVIKYHSDIVR